MKRQAAIVPGLPHLFYPEKSPEWQKLSDACLKLGDEIATERPDVLVLISSQWLSVLGTSFQADPNPKGIHVDENWHEWGDLPFDFKTDPQLAKLCAQAVEKVGYPTKTVCYEAFPIDTGTVVAMKLVNPTNIPVVLLSSWVYANPEIAGRIGETVRETIEKSGRRPYFLASTSLSARYFTDEINPKEDRVSKATDAEWNQKFLRTLVAGDLAVASQDISSFAKEAPIDMQGIPFHWLSGVFKNAHKIKGQLLEYGAIWGTGAAVLKWEGEV